LAFAVAAVAIGAGVLITNLSDTSTEQGSSPSSAHTTTTTDALSTSTTAVELIPLPRVDLNSYCADTFAGATAVAGSDECISAAGDIAGHVNLDEACSQQVAAGSRSVSPTQCSPADPVVVGTPDLDVYCATYGARGRAVLQAEDRFGWRCAVIQSGVFDLVEIDFPAVCRAQFGDETYADYVGEDAGAWRCYGAAA
jgi:hypothetical protein